jgi:excisionase family DNA binding protein
MHAKAPQQDRGFTGIFEVTPGLRLIGRWKGSALPPSVAFCFPFVAPSAPSIFKLNHNQPTNRPARETARVFHKEYPMPSNTQENAKPARLSYTVKDAVYAIGLSRSKLYEMMQTGALHFVKVGNRRLIPVDALASLLVPKDCLA